MSIKPASPNANLLPLLLLENSKIILNTQNLDNVLALTGDRPISVISIVGSPRHGKSLITGYLVKTLCGYQDGNPFWWLDPSEKDSSLNISWPDAKSPATPGVWIVNRPFNIVVDIEDSEMEVAIILLYTQTTIEKLWKINMQTPQLVGLSILLSSCAIFNIHKQMDEQYLAGFLHWIEHAILGSGHELEQLAPGSVFHNILFLFRDWRFPTEYPYGVKGGTEFIAKEKLHNKDTNSSASLVTFRKLISTLFENIGGCLLPFPGQLAVSSKFHGSISELESTFTASLKELCAQVINGEKLKIKRNLNGEFIKQGDLKELVETYVHSVNSKGGHRSLKCVGQILKSSGTIPNQGENAANIVKIAMSVYTSTWKKSLQRFDFLNEEEVKQELRNAKTAADQAITAFLRTQQCLESDEDDPVVESNVQSAIRQRMDAKSQIFRKENDTTRQHHVNNYISELVDQYKSTVSIRFPDSNGPYERHKILKISAETIDEMLEDFMMEMWKTSRTEHEMSDLEEEEHKKVNAALKNEEQLLIHKLVDLKSKLTTNNVNKPNIDSNYKFSPINPIPTNTSESMMSNFEDDPEKSVLKRINISSDRGLFQSPVTSLNWTSLQTTQREGQNRDQLARNAEKFIIDLEHSYNSSLQLYFGRPQDLEQFHSHELPKVLRLYDEKSPYPLQSPYFELYKTSLIEKIQHAYNTVRSKTNVFHQNKSIQMSNTLQTGLDHYRRLALALVDTNFVLQEQLDIFHGDCQSQVSRLVTESIDAEDRDTVKQRLEPELNKLYQELLNKNNRLRNTAINESLKLVSSSMNDYEESIRLARKKCQDNNIETVHYNAVAEVVNFFRANSPVKQDGDLLQEHTDRLKAMLEKALIERKNALQLQRRQSIMESRTASSNALQFYTSEMKKFAGNNEFTSLKAFHEKVSEKAIARFSASCSDTDLIDQLVEKIRVAYIKFEDEHDINSSTDIAIGIDLGTTNSCVSVYVNGKVVNIPSSVGGQTTPSYVLFKPSGEEVVGDEAKNIAFMHPDSTIFDAKRILGRKFDDQKLQEDMKLWPFTVKNNGANNPIIDVRGTLLHPEQISAKVLRALKHDAEAFLRRPVKKAVITVPAYFTDGQRQATIHAGEMAELEVLSILNEPVAAAMAYQLQYSISKDDSLTRHVLVFDLGGGTFDVAVLKIAKGEIRVLAVDGDTHLGGEDFDRNMMEFCVSEFKKSSNIDLLDGKDSNEQDIRDDVRRRLKRLQAECERRKIALSSQRNVIVNVDRICEGIDVDLNVTVTRSKFEVINGDLFAETIKIIDRTLQRSKLVKSKIDEIVMVGGSTRIPEVQNAVQGYFEGKQLNKTIHPDQAVAHGAALHAAILSGNITKGAKHHLNIHDVTPMSLGVELYGGGFSVIIPRDTPIPVTLHEKYKTAHNNQTSVQITIFQGEDVIAKNNVWLGDFYLNGIPPNKAGAEDIHVEMVINTQGILHVTAYCRTGEKRTTTVSVIENKQRMGKETIRRCLDGV